IRDFHVTGVQTCALPISMRWKKFFRSPTGNFATAMGIEHRSIETGDARDSTFLGEDTFPKILDAHPDARDRAYSGDDCAPCLHVACFFPVVSRYAFIH